MYVSHIGTSGKHMEIIFILETQNSMRELKQQLGVSVFQPKLENRNIMKATHKQTRQ